MRDPNELYIDGKAIGFNNMMKRKLNFVDDIGRFTRGFTRVYIVDNELYIGHTINSRKTKIEYEHLEEWIKYFDRI